MSLEKYKEKRSFTKTPEPTGGKPDDRQLHFVVQKHAASHLHYDFRLEMRGVLKSWAVPKGPSVRPDEKRLAMLVEDHPYDYKDFEGIIPEGNYGAGTVIIWDEGTYEPVEEADGKKAAEKLLLQNFYQGKLKIKLKGKKLKGEYALFKAAGRGENSWLLSKLEDKYAKDIDIAKRDKSVISGKTIEQLAKDKNAAEWVSNRKAKSKAKVNKVTTTKTETSQLVKEGKKTAMPRTVSPMLCTLVRQSPNDPGYLYEIKWDGYRIISYANKGKIRLDSRSGLDYSKKYPPVVSALKSLAHDVVLDGEVVVFNEEGNPDFDALQLYNWHDHPISYCVFDLLWMDGYNLMHLPLVQRKEILQQLVADNEVLRFSHSFDDGPALFEEMKKRNLEGVVAKRRDSLYHPGQRGADWLKIPSHKQQEFVIGGWAESGRGRSFRSLLFGAYSDKGELEWIGRSGGGYKEKEMPAMLSQLQKLEVKKSPFVNKVLDTKGAVIHWVKPKLVANFQFATWTKSGRIRKPATFLGFRKDKKPEQVTREVPVEEPAEIKPAEKQSRVKQQKTPKASGNWAELEKISVGVREDFNIGDCSISLNDVDRNVWKGITKAQLIRYYHSMAKYILPHLRDRPLSLHVKPYGATAPGLYIKDMEGRQPDCADIFTDERRHPKAGKRSRIDYLVCNNEATLLYMINLGCVDVNPWMSRTSQPEYPDFINIDLDPSDDDFSKVVEVAMAARDLLSEYKLKSFVKTSGKTGLHLYLPVSAITFAVARDISEMIGGEIRKLVPRISTTSVSKNQRGSKVFIDPSQNDYADTLASAYSARPHVLPTVSAPLDWKEVKPGLDPAAFTIETMEKRVTKKGDLFIKTLDKKVAAANTARSRTMSML